jgi:hypothetical protein
MLAAAKSDVTNTPATCRGASATVGLGATQDELNWPLRPAGCDPARIAPWATRSLTSVWPECDTWNGKRSRTRPNPASAEMVLWARTIAAVAGGHL